MKKVEDYVRSIPDFPEKGIIFRDITTVIQSPEGLKLAIDGINEKLKGVDLRRKILVVKLYNAVNCADAWLIVSFETFRTDGVSRQICSTLNMAGFRCSCFYMVICST